MLRTLIKKQLRELFSFFFYDAKKGKSKNARQMAGTIVLTVIIGIILIFSFGALAAGLGIAYVPMGLDWLYFALLGTIAVFIGSFLDMLTAKNMLFDAKDNDLLLSLPIRPSVILASRMILLFVWGALCTAVIFVPAIVVYFFFAPFSAKALIFAVLTFIVACFAVLVLTCIFGWILAAISSRLKNKSITSVLLALVLLAVYYVCYFKLNTMIANAAANAEKLSHAIQSYLFPFYHMGRGATGNAASFLIFLLITAVLFFLLYVILSRRFISLVTTNRGVQVKEKKHTAKQTSMRRALVRKELIHFSQSPAYMLNTGIGLAILPVAGIAAIIKSGVLFETLGEFAALIGNLDYLALLIPAAAMFGLSMCCISAPSISLEGKSLWLLRSLPLGARDVYESKLLAHLVLCLPSTVIFCVLCAVALRVSFFPAVLVLLLSLAFIALIGVLGLTANVRHPRFSWPNETVVVKQGASVAIALFGGWLIAIFYGFAGYFALRVMPAWLFLLCFTVIVLGVCALLNRWLNRKGAELYEDFDK